MGRFPGLHRKYLRWRIYRVTDKRFGGRNIGEHGRGGRPQEKGDSLQHIGKRGTVVYGGYGSIEFQGFRIIRRVVEEPDR